MFADAIQNDTPVRLYVERFYPDRSDYTPIATLPSPSEWTLPEIRASRVRPYITRLFAQSPVIPDESVDTETEERMHRMQVAHDEVEQRHGFVGADPNLLMSLIEGLRKL